METDLEAIATKAREAGTWLSHRRAARSIERAFAGATAKPLASVKCAFLSSFTIEPLVDFAIVEAAASGIRLDAHVAPYGMVSQEILDPTSNLYAESPDFVVLMSEFPGSSSNVPGGEAHDAAAEAVGGLVALADSFAQHGSGRLLIGTFLAEPRWPLHAQLDGWRATIELANRSLIEALADRPEAQVCDVDALAAYHGYRSATSPQMLAMARIPYSEAFMSLLASKIVSHLKAETGLARKCLVVDCDNTLWGGVVGEEGIDGIALGDGSPGREYIALQQAAAELYREGVLLAINSKNNLEDVIQVLAEHPHMVLREQHFASIQANWDDKVSNMRRIADELNIGIDSLVFVDDNPAERHLVRELLPEVGVLELPEDPALFGRTLRESSEFTKTTVTEDDRRRGEMYAAQRTRAALESAATSLDEFLRSLEMVACVRVDAVSDVKRVAQLTMKTNQFNLTTRRYGEADIARMMDADDWVVFALDVEDRFGDNGTVGVALVEKGGGDWRIDSFLLSCRVIGRRVEEVLLDRILVDAAAGGAQQVRGDFIPTAKNKLAADFYARMRFRQLESEAEWPSWSFQLDQPSPARIEHIRVVD